MPSRKRPVATVSGKEIVESIVKKMKTAPEEGKERVTGAEIGVANGSQARCDVRRCPLRWAGICKRSGPVKDLQEHLISDHHFVVRRKLPSKKHFCTSSGLEAPKEWGHIATVRGHTLAYVIGYQPSISRTHGFVAAFTLNAGAGKALGTVTADLRPVAQEESGGAAGAKYTWSEAPYANADIESVCGFFPVKLFSPRLDVGKPHERAVEVTIQCEG